MVNKTVMVVVVMAMVAGQVAAQCGDAKLKGRSSDPGDEGPWQVGCVRASVGGVVASRDVFFWYPSDEKYVGDERDVFFLREDVPASWSSNISIFPTPSAHCELDMPIDDSKGPYPLVVLLHKDGSFGHDMAVHAAHIASRGFVVAAPTVWSGWMKTRIEKDTLISGDRAPAADFAAAYRAVVANISDVGAAIADLVDMDNIGVVGQGWGGSDALALLANEAMHGPRVAVAIGSATAIVPAMPLTTSLNSLVFYGSFGDGINSQGAEATDPHPAFAASTTLARDDSDDVGKRSVRVEDSGHHLGDMYCQYNTGTDGLGLGLFLGVFAGSDLDYNTAYGADSGWVADGCKFHPTSGDSNLFQAEAGGLTNYVVSAALEEILHCNKAMRSRFASIEKIKGMSVVYDVEGPAASFKRNKSGGLEGWEIFLIIFFVFLLVAAFLFVAKKKKDEKK